MFMLLYCKFGNENIHISLIQISFSVVNEACTNALMPFDKMSKRKTREQIRFLEMITVNKKVIQVHV